MKPKEKIFKAFYKEKKLYYNQIKEETELSHSSLQNTLKKLVEENILEKEKTKSNTFYTIKNKKIAALKFSEISVEKFNNLSTGIKQPVLQFIQMMPQEIFTIVIFGSASKKQEKKGSDIDILVVTNTQTNFEEEKKEANITSNYPLSLFQCSIQEFIENKDHIILQARKTGFPIYKEQNFYEVELRAT